MLTRNRICSPHSSITFSAIESVSLQAGAEPLSVELFNSSQVIWDESAATTSAAASQASTLPKSMSFSFDLTPDLPHCLHLSNSSLKYSLEARLHGHGGQSDAIKAVPVHLTRYTPPGAIEDILSETGSSASAQGSSSSPAPPTLLQLNVGKDFTLSPYTWSITAPTEVHVQMSRSIYRRAEPIELRIKIPPPSQGVVAEKGMRLRAVEADLIRIINTLPKAETGHEEATQSIERTAKEGKGKLAEDSSFEGRTYRADQDLDVPDYEHGEGTSSMPPVLPSFEDPAASASASASASAPPPFASSSSSHPQRPRAEVHESLLAHSGKLCRFHSKRPIILRLTLHPPFDSTNMPHPHPDHDALEHGGGAMVFGRGGRGGGGGCECISQETVLHSVEFEVRIRIAMHSVAMSEEAASSSGAGERRDIRLHKKVYILPGAAGRVLQFEGMDHPEAQEGQLGDASSSAQAVAGSTDTANHLVVPKHSASEKQKARQAAAEAEAFQGPFAGFDGLPEFDGYEDIGRPLSAGPSEDDDDGLQREGEEPEDHHRNLEQLRQFLDHMSGQESNAPPPTLQESRNDVQVEVEVEGVGPAMPRMAEDDVLEYARRHDYQQPPDDFDPPPPMSPLVEHPPDHPSIDTAYASSGADTSMQSRHSQEQALPPSFGDATRARSTHTSTSAAAFPPPYQGRMVPPAEEPRGPPAYAHANQGSHPQNAPADLPGYEERA